MTETTQSLRTKIDRAKDLQSVVRTMKALAASNIGQYEKSVSSLSDYYHTVELGLGLCFRKIALMRYPQTFLCLPVSEGFFGLSV